MKSLLSDKVYDILKWIALIAIPALGEAYVRLANVWNLPYGQQINETALVVTFLLGALIGISTVQYNKNINADITQIGKEIAEENEMKVYDEYLQQEVEVQEDITPEIGVELEMEELKEFRKIEEVEQ